MKKLNRWIGAALIGGSLLVTGNALAQAPSEQPGGQEPSKAEPTRERMDQPAPGGTGSTMTEEEKKREKQRQQQKQQQEETQPPPAPYQR